jgi:LacI family transcriptional regulator
MTLLQQAKLPSRRSSGCELVKSHILTKYKAGEKLPAEEELSKMIGTTRYAAARALTELSAEKIIQRRPGFGTVMANSVANSRIESVGTQVAFMADEFEGFMNTELMRGIDARCREQGLTISLLNSDFSYKEEEKHLRSLGSSDYAGAIVRIGEYKHSFKILEEAVPADYPLVLIDRHDENTKFPCVEMNQEKAAYDAVQYLASLGHRKIAHITYDDRAEARLQDIKQREVGYQKALAEIGVEISDEYVQGARLFGPNERPTDWYFNALGYEPMNRLLLMPERPTAVFLLHCYFAAGVFRAIHDHGLKVPDDISVISIDDAPVARYAPVPLTVVAQPLREMGSVAVDTLIARLEGKTTANRNVLLDGQLIVRESTAPQNNRSV